MDFVLDGADCDPLADVYLYDGSLFVLRDVYGDQSVIESSTSWYSLNFLDQDIFMPLDPSVWTPMSHGTIAEYDSLYTGEFANWDTSLTFERTYYAPRNVDGNPSFVVVKTQVSSPDWSSVDHLTIGSLTDWDLPSELDRQNACGISALASTVYIQGIDTSLTGCQENQRRFGAEMMLGWFRTSDIASNPAFYYPDPYGMFVGDYERDVLPYGSFDPDSLWAMTQNNSGLNTEDTISDLYVAHTFVHDYTLDANDTLVFYTAYLTVQNGSAGDFEELADSVREWSNEHIYPFGCVCGNVDGDASGLVDYGDLTALIAYLFIPPNPAPDDLCTADMDLVPGVTVNDLSRLMAYLYIPPNIPPACPPVPDSTFPYDESDSVLFINVEVPPGVSEWAVDLLLYASDNLFAITVPFSFSLGGAPIVLDSASVHTGGLQIAPSEPKAMWSVEPSGLDDGLHHAATLFFSFPMTSSPDTILIDTTNYHPEHTIVLSRIQSGLARGTIPTVLSRSDLCYASGDADGSGEFTVTDYTLLVDMLYGSQAPISPLYEVDCNGDCVIDTMDVITMSCWLYGGGPYVCSGTYPVPTCCSPTVVYGGASSGALGSASIVTTGDSIEVSNIGWSGNDGVRLYPDSAKADGIAFDLYGVDLTVADAGITFEIKAETNGGLFRSPIEEQALGYGFVGVYNSGSTIQVLADFSLVGDPDVTMKIFNGALPSGENTVAGGGLVAIGTDAGFGIPTILYASIHATDPLGFVILLDRVTKFTMTDATIMYGDVIYLYAKNFTRPVSELFAVDVKGKWLGTIGIAAFERDVCCRGFTGNVDDDAVDLVDIGDLTALISYLYIPPNPEPNCLKEANLDGDSQGLVDIGDITAAISFLYIPPNPPPAVCE
jgi:hypothetical protein